MTKFNSLVSDGNKCQPGKYWLLSNNTDKLPYL